jgi:6-phosphogluconolactonase
MPCSRRDFVATVALGAVACARVRPASGGGVSAATGDATWPLYVGTYTEDGRSRGVYRLAVDRATGAMRDEGLAADTPSPSFLALAPDGRALYAVNELTEYEGAASGSVTALARDAATGALSPRGRRATRGGAPCYVTADRTGRHVLVANYVGGSVAVLPVLADGGVGEATAVVRHAGRGPHAGRQEGPHAHCVIVAPDNRFALAADLGIDRVRVYRFDAARGTLAPADAPEAVLRPGAGPRHLAFAPGGRTLYLVNELDSTLVAFAYDAATGALAERQTLSTRPDGATGENLPADLHVHPSGRAVYASNRGDDTVAVFAVAPDTGRLALQQVVPTGGRWPRNFALDPAGRLLLVANQRSDAVVAFHVAADTGRLTPAGARATLPSPVCLRFAGATTGGPAGAR